MNPNDPKNLEQFIHQTLRSLPERHAPSTLEHRVLSAITARKALPWWHQSFSHWPSVAKLGFASVCVLAVATIASFDPTRLSHLSEWVQNQASALNPLRSTANTLGDTGALVISKIPSLYIYGALATIAALYAALFGIGAAAYRTLFTNR